MSQSLKTFSQSLHHRLDHLSYILKVEYVSIFIVWLFTISSLIGIGMGHVEWFVSKTPLNLLLCFLLILINVPFDKKFSKGVFLIVFLLGMILEIVGVWRGDIFGVYHYGENLGFKVMGVPLMIGIYWAVLTVVSSQISRLFSSNIFVVALTGSALMVGLDFLMEQMAHVFDYWHFTGGIAPFQNYVTWYIAAFFLHLLSFRFFNKGGGRFSIHLYLNQIVFFLGTYLLIQL
ncbi:MAG: carotenoid biosynthesis protein [Bacteroidota bacterium]